MYGVTKDIIKPKSVEGDLTMRCLYCGSNLKDNEIINGTCPNCSAPVENLEHIVQMQDKLNKYVCMINKAEEERTIIKKALQGLTLR